MQDRARSGSGETGLSDLSLPPQGLLDEDVDPVPARGGSSCFQGQLSTKAGLENVLGRVNILETARLVHRGFSQHSSTPTLIRALEINIGTSLHDICIF